MALLQRMAADELDDVDARPGADEQGEARGGRVRGALAGRMPERGELVLPGVAASALTGLGGCVATLGPGLQVAAPGGLLVGTVTAAGMLAASRERERAALVGTLQRSLRSQIGLEDASKVVARKWVEGWVGIPGRLTITYDPQVPATLKPELASTVGKIVGARLRRDYELVGHDARRCRLEYAVLPPALTPEEAPDPQLAARALSIGSSLFGEGMRIEDSWEGTALKRLEIAHDRGLVFSPNHAARAKAEKTINAMLPGRWRAKWDLQNDTVVFEQRRELPKSVPYPVGVDVQPRCLPYGEDEDGNVCQWDMRNSAGQPHMIVTGATGSGKTVTIRSIVIGATRLPERPARVRIADIKRIEFLGLKDWPNVEVLATTVESIAAVIHSTFKEMEHRYDLIAAGEADEDDFEDLILILDEYRYTYGRINAWWSQVKPPRSPKEAPVFEEVFLIASLGRSCRVHVLIGTQRPDASWLGGDVRDQFVARASLGRLSPDGAKMMWESYSVGTSVPRKLPGRGTTIGGSGTPEEFQSYWIPDPRKADSAEDEAILAALRPAEVTYPRMVFLPPQPGFDLDGMPTPVGFFDWIDAPLVLASEHPEAELETATFVTGGGGYTDAAGQAPGTEYEDSGEVEYEDAVEVRAGELFDGAEGVLLLLDERLDLWGVIDSVEEDLAAEGHVCICWRSDDDGDDEGVESFPASERLTIRRPTRENEEAE